MPRPRRTATLVEHDYWIYGRHAVTAALANPDRGWRRLAVLAGQEREATGLIAGARAAWHGEGQPTRVLDRRGFAVLLSQEAVHQGLALLVEPLAERDIEDVLRHAGTISGRCVVLILDQVSDPQNLGAILRSSAAFGALAAVIAQHGAPSVTGALAKAASGALECVPLVRVVNLARTLDRMKQEGFWICGLDESAEPSLSTLDLGKRSAIVLGGEGRGMRRLVRERCDYLARLPTRSAQTTLNLSNAAAVALYELVCGRPID